MGIPQDFMESAVKFMGVASLGVANLEYLAKGGLRNLRRYFDEAEDLNFLYLTINKLFKF